MHPSALDWTSWPPWCEEDISRGFQKVRITRSSSSPPVSAAAAAAAAVKASTFIDRRDGQRLRRDGDVVLGEIFESKGGASGDSAKSISGLPGNENGLIMALERALTTWASAAGRYGESVSCNAYRPDHRRSIGLPSDRLVSNERLLATRDHLEGIHYGNATMTKTEYFSFIHKGEANLQLVSTLWSGDPVVWVVIPPRHSDKLESRVKEHLKLAPKCSQFVRHENLILPPSTLRKWGLSFHVVIQGPGEAVRTDYLAYSYTWHTGPGILETVHCCENDWNLPPMYVFCRPSQKCGAGPHPTATALAIDQPPRTEDLEVVAQDHRRLVVKSLPPVQPIPKVSGETKTNDVDLAGLVSDHDINALSTFSTPAASARMAPIHPISNNLGHVGSLGDGLSTTDGEGFLASFMCSSLVEIQSDTLIISSPDAASVVEGSPYGFQAHSPGSDYFISTDYVSQRRLPGEQPNLITRPEFRHSILSSSDDSFVEDFLSDFDDGDGATAAAKATTRGPSVPLSDADNVADLGLSSPLQDRMLPTDGQISIELQSSESPGGLGANVERQNDGYLTPPTSESAAAVRGIGSVPVAQELTREFHQLFALGMQRRQHFKWFGPGMSGTSDDSAVETIMRTLLPMEWLNDNAVMQILYRLTIGREEVHVVDSHSFQWALEHQNARAILPKGSPSLVLIPVFRRSHWFLVSLQYGPRVLTIHDHGNHEGIDEFIRAGTTEKWSLQIRSELVNDGQNCGIILLQEAELLLRKDLNVCHNYFELRRRYLHLLLDTMTPDFDPQTLFQDARRASPLEGHAESRNTPEAFRVRQQAIGRSTRTGFNPEYLASAVGCAEVLKDFRTMAKLLRESPARDDASIEIALAIFTRGRLNKHLGSLQQDYSSLRVARRYRELLVQFREDAVAQRKLKRKWKHSPASNPPDLSNPPRKRGVGADSQAYRKMMDEWKEPIIDADALLGELKAANERGKPLLQYEIICGTDHPIWMLLPARKMKSPMDGSWVKRSMYRDLHEEESRLLVETVRVRKPALWHYLPRLEKEFTRLLQGGEAELDFLEDIDEHQ